MGLITPIRSSQVISLDTNIFIRALDDNGELGDQARNLLEHIKEIKPKVYISAILLEEFFVKVFKNNRGQESDYIMDFLTIGGLARIFDVNPEIAILAAKIRADHGVKAPDAFHLASALYSQAKIFITADRKIPRTIKGLKVVILQK